MKGKIPEALFKVTGGSATWQHYGVTDAGRELGWQKYVTVDLEQITVKRLKRMAEMIEPHTKIKGAAMLLKDIRAWIRIASKEGGSVKPRTVEQFASMLQAYLLHVPGHRVYERDALSEVWLPYYVEDITYHPPHRRSGDYESPPCVSADLFYEEFGKRRKENVIWHAEHCLHLTVADALARKGYYIETPEMRKEYLADVERWKLLVPQIGLQLLGRGRATDNLDGNPEKDRWSSYHADTIVLDHDGKPARLVVDVFQETDKVQTEREDHIDLWFWSRKMMKLNTSNEEGEDDSYENLNEEADEDDDDDDEEETRERADLDEEDVSERPAIEVPIHANLACFDLKRHLRLRVHVGCVEVYKYDTTLAEKLVLPQQVLDFVELLINNKEEFIDIVAGKSGGSIVLCCGKPGVGKTLTAEVYSESSARPLYSVQCSQLGITPSALEANLFRIFARSQRWNAILLLDEADVYLMSRGDDLVQNAIVGVFLRVLEYYAGVMFLTTNRADKVDDAIASRCIARIDYEMPPPEDQKKLWRVLSDTAGVKLPDTTIEAILAKYNKLSGRDVKNLLKLSALVCRAWKYDEVTLGNVDFVKKFKPTIDVADDKEK